MTSTFTPNADQEAAAEQFFRFLMSDDKEFRLSGGGGTGKTSLMQHIMKNVVPEYASACKLLGQTPVDYTIVLTATTNQATEVLYERTKYPAQTIHSFMNLKVKEDFKTGETRCERTDNWVVHTRTLLFIDEASMIDAALYKFIQQGTDKTCKIVYLGDMYQLAPVKEKLSMVYREKTNTAELLTPVRNASQPALVNLCNQMRRNVDELTFPDIQPVPGVIEYLDDSQAQQFLDRTFPDPNVDCRVLAYSNARVVEYNQYIRALRGLPSGYCAGEELVVASAYAEGNQVLRVQQQVTVTANLCGQYVERFFDGEIEMDVYRIRIKTRGGLSLDVRQPVFPEHLKEVKNYLARTKAWRKLYTLKNKFPDLRPRDASTVYKAQGSTFESVFLDLTNIGKCTDNTQIARMLYVGVTRPTTRLYLYGSLPARLRVKQASLQTA